MFSTFTFCLPVHRWQSRLNSLPYDMVVTLFGSSWVRSDEFLTPIFPLSNFIPVIFDVLFEILRFYGRGGGVTSGNRLLGSWIVLISKQEPSHPFVHSDIPLGRGCTEMCLLRLWGRSKEVLVTLDVRKESRFEMTFWWETGRVLLGCLPGSLFASSLSFVRFHRRWPLPLIPYPPSSPSTFW